MSTTLAALSADISALAATAAAATVTIGRNGRGSGIVIGTDEVLTSAHNLRDRTTQVTLPDGTQQLRRWVSEVVLVEPGERELGYALEHLCGPSKNGPAQASGILPPQVMALAEFGFNPDLFQSEADSSGWTP